MTTRKSRAPKPSSDTGTVTISVVEPHLVFHDGEQRGGTIDGVPATTAAHWLKHGWITINDDPPAVEDKPTGDTK